MQLLFYIFVLTLTLVISLRWGLFCSLIFSGLISVLIIVVFSLHAHVIPYLVLFFPTVIVGYLSCLARPANEIGGPEKLIAWYPLADIMTYLCGMVAISISFITLINLKNYADVNEKFTKILEKIIQNYPKTFFDFTKIEKIKYYLILYKTFVISFSWVLIIFTIWYITMHIVSNLGLSPRPRENISSSLRMNRLSIPIFATAVATLLFGSTPSIIAASTTGAFFSGFLLSGFARLHFVTHEKNQRLLILLLAYISILFIIPMFVIAAYGLTETTRSIIMTPESQKKSRTKSDV
ncbi:hypothetical protein B488_03190 [Liberibacter crescens BT-1]|uniref:DUF2232 domain-containing protein n=1 Tax=Liberibacter crescens (strain BT-1) TaxID=1215343 RepID=L0ETM4_LIBCB|nr:hypothetical protein [Liberibacter crescens]AGA64312.1 hypothetical protein B488_03190 [Liberibacter crescens BT-1]AMC12525.1 hypothetical protein RL73_01770 [Liberibacter crescens]